MGISSHGIKLAEPGAGAGEQDVAQRVERVLSLAREITALPILEEGSPDESSDMMSSALRVDGGRCLSALAIALNEADAGRLATAILESARRLIAMPTVLEVS